MFLGRYVIRAVVISKSSDRTLHGVKRNYWCLRRTQSSSIVKLHGLKSILRPTTIDPSVLVCTIVNLKCVPKHIDLPKWVLWNLFMHIQPHELMVHIFKIKKKTVNLVIAEEYLGFFKGKFVLLISISVTMSCTSVPALRPITRELRQKKWWDFQVSTRAGDDNIWIHNFYLDSWRWY